MAALGSGASLFPEQSWVLWAKKIEGEHKEEPEVDSCSKKEKEGSDTMKLRRTDMSLYGLCPARDEFYLVVCECCGQLIKPQAFKTHIEQRHQRVFHSKPSSTETQAVREGVGPCKKPDVSPAKSARHNTKSDVGPAKSARHNTKSPSKRSTPTKLHPSPTCANAKVSPPVVSHWRPVNTPVRLSTSEKMCRSNHSLPVVKVERMQDPLAKTVMKSEEADVMLNMGCGAGLGVKREPSVRVTPAEAITRESIHWPVSKVERTNATVTPSAMTACMTAAAATVTSSKKMPRERKLLPCKDREFDADKHCGVWITEISRQCTRSLTCKTHALSLRRGVIGRAKSFDSLLLEHRAVKEAMQLAKGVVPRPRAGGIAGRVGSPTNEHAPELGGALSPKKGLPKQSPSAASSSSSLHASTSRHLSTESSRLSSEGEDDDDEYVIGDASPLPRNKQDSPYLTFHPRPAAVNQFGSWLHGSGCHVFNRKEDLTRAAFYAAVHRHLHPPPHKRLCVESKLPQGSHVMTNAKDPYDFGESAGSSSKLCGAGKQSAGKVRPKVTAERVVGKPEVWLANRTVSMPAAPRPVAGAKRKRTGSAAEVTSPPPICLAPVSLGASSRLPSGALLTNHLLRDVNIILDGGTGGLVNGQLLSIPATVQLPTAVAHKRPEYTADTLNAIMTALPGVVDGAPIHLVAGSAGVNPTRTNTDIGNSLWKPAPQMISMTQQNGVTISNLLVQPEHRNTVKTEAAKAAAAAVARGPMSRAHMTLTAANLQSFAILGPQPSQTLLLSTDHTGQPTDRVTMRHTGSPSNIMS